MPAGLAVCRAPLYEQVVHALIGSVHVCEGLAEPQLLAFPCMQARILGRADHFSSKGAGPGFLSCQPVRVDPTAPIDETARHSPGTQELVCHAVEHQAAGVFRLRRCILDATI